MKRRTGIFFVAVVGAMSVALVHAKEHYVSEDGMFYAEAEVTDVQPIVRIVRVVRLRPQAAILYVYGTRRYHRRRCRKSVWQRQR